MKKNNYKNIAFCLNIISLITAFTAFIIGITVVLGWLIDIPALKVFILNLSQ